jgi:RNA polymerase sigma-70 factor (ECF subfamily)
MKKLMMGRSDAQRFGRRAGKALKEAAVVSGLSIGALKVATHRAMTALRRTLDRPESHED